MQQIIEKKKRDSSEEVEVMLRFSEHPNIVTLHDVYEDQDHVYLFMDLLEGGELLDRILRIGFSEAEASVVIEIIAKVVHYLHENGVSFSRQHIPKLTFPDTIVCKLCQIRFRSALNSLDLLSMDYLHEFSEFSRQSNCSGIAFPSTR